ncbi:MAG: helix-turn-helix transcriptional regulator [Rhizobiaceae bacterium]|nr:helix-turn-helix transcriptional regulator [Rhizobiaceae bacterium]
MELEAHGPTKYPHAALLLSSAGRGWSELAAELRSHPVSEMPGLVPQQVEISIAICGRNDGLVLRTGGGERQETRPVSGTIWLSPIGIADNDIRVTVPLPKVLHLYLPARRFSLLAEEYDLPPAPAHSIHYRAGFQDELIRQIGLTVIEELRNETASGRMLVETCSLMLAARLAHSYGDGWSLKLPRSSVRRLDDIRLRRIRDYVAAHLDEDITVADLAAVANLSLFHFTRLFTATTGMPPHRYVAQQRLERSMAQLASGQMALSDIAFGSCFSSQASFSRAFRRATGMTPGQYRKLFR